MKDQTLRLSAICTVVLLLGRGAISAEPRTTLENPRVRYRVADGDHFTLARGPVKAVIINNQAGGDALPQHRAGYSGVGSLTHEKRKDNLFVPAYAGLNFEHIHDGTVQDRKILFEPRNAPMELRVLDKHTVELYQAATPHWGLESVQRYQILEDGALEMTLECIPRRRAFKHNYIGLFWASYIHQPESLDIHLLGRDKGENTGERWIRGVTPSHGVRSSHLAVGDNRTFKHDEKFPLTLVFNRSNHRHTQAWYYGVSHGMAYVLMFRPRDQVRLAQSPSGGGKGNPAWDFQHFIADYKVGQRYQLVMRVLYTPFESAEQIERLSRPHRAALAKAR